MKINDEIAPPRQSWLVRQLLMLPPTDLPDDETDQASWAQSPSLLPDGHRVLLTRQRKEAITAAHAAAAEALHLFEGSDPEAVGMQALASAGARSGSGSGGGGKSTGGRGHDAGTITDAADERHGGAWWMVHASSMNVAPSNLEMPHAVSPVWATRLRSVLPQPCPEVRSYYDFVQTVENLIAAGAPNGKDTNATEDIGPRLVPGAVGIEHMPYGTKWDSITPVVLTGERVGWPAKDWGWEFWEREHGDQFVVCKQRAPLFDEDQTSGVLMAECTLREAMAYARTAHLAPVGEAPVLYMNGWDVFEALPDLWEPGMDEIPGTIDNLTGPLYAMFQKNYGLGEADAQSLVERRKRLCKLFVGATGAITRIHTDNHYAHAWLCNIRGRKLYVCCSPADDDKVATKRSRDKGRGTQYEGRLDPLDPAQRKRAERQGLTLYATVLEPGQTILAPEGWWHYAVSLTPTITLMNNFWDKANMRGLQDLFCGEISKVLDSHRREQADAKHAEARADAPQVPLVPPVTYVVLHKPFVFVRDRPSTRGSQLGHLMPGKTFTAAFEQDGWVRSTEPFDKGKYAWTLLHGGALGLGPLLVTA